MGIRGNTQGFTLIEVMISIVILSFISFGIVQVTDDSIKTKERVVGEDREVLQVETAMTRLEDDLASMYTPLFFAARAVPASSARANTERADEPSRYDGKDRFAFVTTLGHPVPIIQNPDKQTLEFMIFNNKRRLQDSKQSNFAWVRYSVRKSTATTDTNEGSSAAVTTSTSTKEHFDLMRAQVAEDPYMVDKLDWENANIKAYPLINNLINLEFQFWDEEKKKFVESLNDIQDGKYLIRGIKVKLTWVNKLGEESEEELIVRSSWPFFKEKVKRTSGSDSEEVDENDGDGGGGGGVGPVAPGTGTGGIGDIRGIKGFDEGQP
ncbi:MAG: prepilin-type N-terminal cleavage/methylation domain-containing protein [Oligoflexia bacterium]|nr:prepilin-type N-terminal cleavage/methylation domain-containing protein [Oligoflexia bacterium]